MTMTSRAPSRVTRTVWHRAAWGCHIATHSRGWSEAPTAADVLARARAWRCPVCGAASAMEARATPIAEPTRRAGPSDSRTFGL